MRLCFSLALALFTLACTGHRPEREKFYSAARVDASAYPDVAAVVLLDRAEMLFSYSQKAKKPYAQVLVTKRMQIFKEEGLAFTKFRLPFDDQSQVLWTRARVTKPSGRVVELDSKISIDVPRFVIGSPAGKLYPEEGAKVTKIRGAEVGDVVELQYLRVYRDPRWVDPIRIGGDLPVVRGEIVVEYPKKYDVDVRLSKLNRQARIDPVKLPIRIKDPDGNETNARGTRLTFVFKNEPAIYPEERRPDVAALATQVHVQLRSYTLGQKTYPGFTTWDDVARWYLTLTDGKDRPDAYLEKTLRKLGGKSGSKGQKVARVQRYLQDRIADAPSFSHLAALPAHGPETILKAGVGDSKDQASLGLAMLRLLGLDGFPVLVSRLGSFAQVPDLPTPAPFNHVILAIPAGGKYEFIDPSTPALPRGRLPGALQGQRGLLVRPGGAELIDLPLDEPRRNTRLLTYKLKLSSGGIASGNLRVKLTGLDAARVRSILLRGEDVAKEVQDYLLPGPEFALSFREVLAQKKTVDRPDRPLVLHVVLHDARIARGRGGELEFLLQSIFAKPLPELWRDGRRMPLVLDHPYEMTQRLSLELPAGFGLESAPNAIEAKGPMSGVTERIALQNGVFLLDRVLTIEARNVAPEDYAVFKRPIERIWIQDTRPLLLVEGGDRGQNYEGDPF